VVVGRQMKTWKNGGILASDRGHWSVDDLPALIEKPRAKLKLINGTCSAIAGMERLES